MEAELNPIDRDSQENQPQAEDSPQPLEDTETNNLSQEDMLMDLYHPQPVEEFSSADPLQGDWQEPENDTQDAETDQYDVPQPGQPPDSLDQEPAEGTEPIYTSIDVQPLEEEPVQLLDDVDTAQVPTTDQQQDESYSQLVEDIISTCVSQEDLCQEELDVVPAGDIDSLQPDQEQQSPEVSGVQSSEDTASVIPSPVEQATEESYLQSTEEPGTLYSIQEVQAGSASKKIALILSGGGARGAFQVGAEMYARQVKGYHWDIIAGVSVGALNGAMLAMHRYQRLLEIWDTISNDQVYTGGFNLPSVVKLLLGAKSFYSNAPLQKMMKKELAAGKIIDDLHVGVVSLVTGEYLQFTKEFLELPQALLASSSIPVIWPPVNISPEYQSMVDGGVRNISPVGDVLELEPDEIVIINCSPENPPSMERAPDHVLSIGMRAIDIMLNEIFVNDLKEFLRINALVQEAEKQGAVLHHPHTGRLLKYYPCVVIAPDAELGEVLDFTPRSVQTALKAGVKRARQVLGRP